MSYLVLARKYRPQRFEDLIGQEHVSRTLTNAIGLGRVHHAFLFTGARGVGKTSAARILAKALCCKSGPTATPCGTCDFCQEIASGQSVDVLEIDGASNTGVDDVRALREGVRYLPSKGLRKVYIIDEVHMLSTSAFNALLKTLEEPPAHVVFILATTEVHKIPSTILSRCQRYDFKLIPTAGLVTHLNSVLTQEKIAFEPDGLRLLARQAAGSVRDALSLLDQVIAFVGTETLTRARIADVLGVADRTVLVDLLTAVLDRDAGKALRRLESAVDRGIDLLQLSRAFLSYLHDAEIAGLVADPSDILDITAEELTEAKTLAQQAGRGLLPVMFDRWARGVDEAARSQTSRLILEMALIDLCAAEPLQPLGDLLSKLEELEGRLSSGAPRSAPPASTPRRPSGESARPSPGRDWDPPVSARPANDVERPAPVSQPSESVKTPPGDAEEAFRILRLRFQNLPSVAAALDHSEVGVFEPGRVVIRLGDALLRDRLEKHRPALEGALTDILRTPTKVAIEAGGKGIEASVVKAEVTREADQRERTRVDRTAEAKAHPLVKRAQEIFGVAVREIKVL